MKDTKSIRIMSLLLVVYFESNLNRICPTVLHSDVKKVHT